MIKRDVSSHLKQFLAFWVLLQPIAVKTSLATTAFPGLAPVIPSLPYNIALGKLRSWVNY